MQQVRLGNSGLKVSRIALGCMSFGETTAGFNHWALGDDDFRARIEKQTGRRAAPLPKGKRAEMPEIEPAEPFL